jgi:hypothetical protein
MSDHFPDLRADELLDGNFELSQQYGLDEPSIIEVHRLQIRWLAERVGLFDDGAMTAREVRVERIMMVLCEEIAAMRTNCPPEVWARLAGVRRVAALLLAEFDPDVAADAGDRIDAAPTPGPCTDNSPCTDKCECTDKSPGISGAPNAPSKRGRPATGDALSNTERSRRRRAKLAGTEVESLPINFEATP